MTTEQTMLPLFTPHLAGIMQVWSVKDASAQSLTAKAGVSNRRIGETFNTGGIIMCDGQAVIVVPDRQWQSTMAETISDGTIPARRVADTASSEDIKAQPELSVTDRSCFVSTWHLLFSTRF